MKTLLKLRFVSVCIVMLLFFASCNEAGDSKTDTAGSNQLQENTNQSQAPLHQIESPDGGVLAPKYKNGGKDGGLIAHFKPALVVRATGCIMCHANINSNIITDFGYGNDYFFGANVPTGITRFSGAIYGNHTENWASAKLRGDIIVPKTPVIDSEIEKTLAEYMRETVTATDATSPVPTVVEKDIVYIGAPSESRILELAGTFPDSHPSWKVAGRQIGASISGLRLAVSGQYVENTPGEELVCYGDLIVNSVLFLNQLKLRTDNGGCRIYSTKTVFIQGAITYLGTAEDRNLQISSARAIVSGLGPQAIDWSPTYDSLVYRLINFWTRFGYFTRDASHTTQEKLDAIVMDASYISELIDSTSQPPNGRNVAFSRLLLNAPNVQSRYKGDFKGVIIAELAIASLGQFAFEFDPVFERVPVLPLLDQYEYLRIE